MNKKQNIICVLIFVEILLSIYLVYSESQNYSYCIIGNTCDLVQTSSYGYIMGIPLAWIGFISFIFLLLLFYLQKQHKFLRIIYYLTVFIGVGYAIYLISIQAFVLKKFCTICMLIDPLMIIIAIITLVDLYQKRKLPHDK